MPLLTKVFKGSNSFSVRRSVVNLARIQLKRLNIRLFKAFGGITQFMHPAALMFGVRIDNLYGVNESFRAIVLAIMKRIPKLIMVVPLKTVPGVHFV